MPIKGDRDYESHRRGIVKYKRKQRQEEAARKNAEIRSKIGGDGILDSNPLKLDDGKGVDWGYVNKWRGAEMADAAYRKAYPYIKLRSVYSQIVGDPPKCGPDDRKTAQLQVWKIEQALEKGMWTKNENKRLHQMLAKWKKRAAGKDARYVVAGNKSHLNQTDKTGYEIVKAFLKIRRELGDKGE